MAAPQLHAAVTRYLLGIARISRLKMVEERTQLIKVGFGIMESGNARSTLMRFIGVCSVSFKFVPTSFSGGVQARVNGMCFRPIRAYR